MRSPDERALVVVRGRENHHQGALVRDPSRLAPPGQRPAAEARSAAARGATGPFDVQAEQDAASVIATEANGRRSSRKPSGPSGANHHRARSARTRPSSRLWAT